ncbi:hypothetical protein GVN21_02235 [Caulobacter sp. SLTY]|jgi:hypothetical protein|uniref:CC_3452 family protein n=1 Tax=Caulobacter sp. SLTY TaxID=2683262 RepID=UPI001412707B|nr:hypothetical protein [Caulobacter sp. SLTY]NBB14170.1 hypothetical protein [Caulobacter sp. SLTY]
MKLQVLAAAAALSLAFAGSSIAADGKIIVTLKTPVAAKTKVIAAGAVFNCEGSTCVAAVAPSRTDTAKGCKALSKEVGEVVTFGSLTNDDLAKCGAVSATTRTQAAN